MKKLQLEMAKNFLRELKENYGDFEELDAMDILDTLGVCGLSFTISEDASDAFIAELGATPYLLSELAELGVTLTPINSEI
jgi:F420-0:gamma-glutamyl ligase-like protein